MRKQWLMVNGHVCDFFSSDTEIPFIFPYLTIEMVILFSDCLEGLYFILCVCVCVCMCVSRSVVSDSASPSMVTGQAPLSMGFSRQGYWSGLPSPSPGDLPNPGMEPRSPHCRWILNHWTTGEVPVLLIFKITLSLNIHFFFFRR